MEPRIKYINSFYLIIDKPYIIKKAKFSKFAVPKGNPAELVCRSKGVPNVEFTWEISSGSTLRKIHPEEQYRNELIKTEKLVPGQKYTWDSVLRLNIVRSEYYTTTFRCTAENKFGNDTHIIELVPRGKPDPPRNVKSLGSDYHSVTLMWEPGFDGGYNQTYKVIVTEERTGQTVYNLQNVDKIPTNTTRIIGLKPHTPYSFKVIAKNQVGYSEPGGEVIKKTEKKKDQGDEADDVVPRVAIVGMVITGILILIVIAVITTCCIKQHKDRSNRRRSRTNATNALHPKNKNNSVMIERYTPTKYSNELFFPSIEKPRSNSVSSSLNLNYKVRLL